MMGTETKKKIIRALKPKKKFMVRYAETRYYEKEVEAVDEKEAGEIEMDDEDVIDIETRDENFEVEEI